MGWIWLSGHVVTIVTLWGDVFKTVAWKQILRNMLIQDRGLPVCPLISTWGVCFSIFPGTKSAVVLTTGGRQSPAVAHLHVSHD